MIDDEMLDRQLREAVPYIDDDGFTARVMSRLPAAPREPRWLRAMVLLGLALLGSGVAYLLSGGLIREGLVQMVDFPIWLLLVFAFGCGLVVGAFAVIFAIRKTPEVRDLTRLNF
jgi:anti-sigma factor RsiW